MTNRQNDRLRLATVGLGNWAGRVVDLLVQQQASSTGEVELVSLYEPDLVHHARRAEVLRKLGVKLTESFEELLKDDRIEAVVLPVPIHLHRPMTEQALAAGKAVLVEKPAAGCVQDVDAMIASRDRAKRPVLVSFQDTYDPHLLTLKRAILGGVIGNIKSVTLVGCWPRDEAYYRRTTWAGRIWHEGVWVLDSPVTNAFAHYLHLVFFLLGDAEASWAQPTSVEAELYRAYDIDNYDTASQRFTANGVPVLVLLTHACRESIGPHVQIMGEKGVIHIDLYERVVRIIGPCGNETTRLTGDSRAAAINAFARHVRGLNVDAALSTLEAARVHVVATNGASQAAMVRRIDAGATVTGMSPDGEPCRFIPGIERIFTECARRGQMLHESALASWSTPPGRMSLLGYTRFTGVPASSTFVQNIAVPVPAASARVVGQPG